MHTYERCFLTYEEAKDFQQKTGGKITTFLSTGENNEIITVYSVRYKQKF